MTNDEEELDPEVAKLVDGSLINILLPHVQPIRTAARILTVDTRLAAINHDSERVVENIETIFGMAHQASDGKILVCSLVGIAVGNMGMDLIQEVLQEHPDLINTEQLARLQNHLEDIHFNDWIHLDGERAMMHDMVQRVFTDNGSGDGRFTPIGMEMISSVTGQNRRYWSKEYPEFETVINFAQQAVEPALYLTVASRKDTLDAYDELMDELEADLKLPAWEAEWVNYDKYLAENHLRMKVLDLMVPATDQVRHAKELLLARRNATVAVIASYRYFDQHRTWPTSLEDLTPKFIESAPVDIITGDPLFLKSESGIVTVYSRGMDQDDDSGMPQVRTYVDEKGIESPPEPAGHYHFFMHGKYENHQFDGDWILWPLETDRQKVRLLQD